MTISAWVITFSNLRRSGKPVGTAETIAMATFLACLIARSALFARCRLGGTSCKVTSMLSSNNFVTTVDTSLSRHWNFGNF